MLFLAGLVPVGTHAIWTYNPCPYCGSNSLVLSDEVPATCTRDGVRIWHCNDCTRDYEENVPATDHDWSAWTYDAGALTPTYRAPTCTEGGQEYRRCSMCGEMETRDVPALGHDWDEGIEMKPATCTEDGLKICTCTRCGAQKNEIVPALEHDWEEPETTEPEGMTDGKTVTRCKRCGEEKTEIVFASGSFFASLRNKPLDTGGMHITKQPVGGTLERNTDESVTLTVAVEGGVPPYTYEWHRKNLENESRAAALRPGIEKVAESFKSQYAGMAGDWFNANSEAYSGAFNQSWLSEVAAGQSTLFGGQSFFDHPETTDSPDYDAGTGNCEYWCEISDSEGHSITSDTVQVYYKLRIAEQTVSANWQADMKTLNTDGGDVEYLELMCRAEDGSGDYLYKWYSSEDAGEPFDLGETVKVTALGTYWCEVSDRDDGSSARTKDIEVYSGEPFKLVGVGVSAKELWPEEVESITAVFSGGEKPYTVQWEKDGEPIDTREALGLMDQTRYIAESSAAGVFTVRAVDARGAQIVRSTTRKDKQLTISEQPEGGYLPKNGATKLSAGVSDGKEPYTFELYRNGSLYLSENDVGSSHSFSVSDSGEYYFRIVDSDGHYGISDSVMVEDEFFRIIEQSESAGIEEPNGTAELYIRVSGGEEPYSYQWIYTDSGRRYTAGSGREIQVGKVGEYYCKIKDAKGESIQSKTVDVFYRGKVPWIISSTPFRILGTGDSTELSCTAISGSGNNSNLRYDWYDQQNYGRWELFAADTQTVTTSFAWNYRCKVTDLATGETAYSEVTPISRELKLLNLSDYRFYEGASKLRNRYTLTFSGGKSPYTMDVYVESKVLQSNGQSIVSNLLYDSIIIDMDLAADWRYDGTPFTTTEDTPTNSYTQYLDGGKTITVNLTLAASPVIDGAGYRGRYSIYIRSADGQVIEETGFDAER